MGQLARPEAPQAPAPAGLAAGDAERVRKAFAAALAENTRRAYLGHWAAFGEWCAENGYPPPPRPPRKPSPPTWPRSRGPPPPRP